MFAWLGRLLNKKPPFDPRKALIQKGEYFPLKGFWFQVTDVKEKGITARVSGVTKKLQPILGAKNKTAKEGAH
jgi:hypothetical protein